MIRASTAPNIAQATNFGIDIAVAMRGARAEMNSAPGEILSMSETERQLQGCAINRVLVAPGVLAHKIHLDGDDASRARRRLHHDVDPDLFANLCLAARLTPH